MSYIYTLLLLLLPLSFFSCVFFVTLYMVRLLWAATAIAIRLAATVFVDTLYCFMPSFELQRQKILQFLHGPKLSGEIGSFVRCCCVERTIEKHWLSINIRQNESLCSLSLCSLLSLAIFLYLHSLGSAFYLVCPLPLLLILFNFQFLLIFYFSFLFIISV